MNNPNKVITHHAVSLKTHTAEDVGQWHLDRWDGYSPSTIRDDVVQYCGYHDVIEWDGTWVKARAWTDEGIHCRGENFSSLGVCFMGNNDNHYPSEAQKATWRDEYFPAVQEKYPHITNQDTYPHRKYANKSCHGKLLSDDYYILLLGEYKKLNIKQLTIKLLQLQVKLLTMLLKERRRG